MNRKQAAIGMVAMLIVGLFFGYMWGVYSTLNWGYDIAQEFVTIDVDKDKFVYAIMQYKHHIEECYSEEKNSGS